MVGSEALVSSDAHLIQTSGEGRMSFYQKSREITDLVDFWREIDFFLCATSKVTERSKIEKRDHNAPPAPALSLAPALPPALDPDSPPAPAWGLLTLLLAAGEPGVGGGVSSPPLQATWTRSAAKKKSH